MIEHEGTFELEKWKARNAEGSGRMEPAVASKLVARRS
jgi:hypothetical protein